MDWLGMQGAPTETLHEEPTTLPTRDTITAAPANESSNTAVDTGATTRTAPRTTVASPHTDHTQVPNNTSLPAYGTTQSPRRAPSRDPGPDSFAERHARRVQAVREAISESNSSRRQQDVQGRSATAHRQRERIQGDNGFGWTSRPTRLEREVDLSSFGERASYDELDDPWQDDDIGSSPVEILNALRMILGSAGDPRRRLRDIYEDILAEEEAEDRAELDNTTWFELSEAGRRALEEQGIAMPRQGETWTFVGEEYAERLRRAFGQN
ncbi:hypothetical protein NU219Hw_g3141t1 [Hortaea werneckii]